MSKERIDDIKEAYEMNKYDENYGLGMKDIEWLIEQAELMQRFAQKNGELNVFLNKYIEPKHLGKNVIDVAMTIIENQTERVQELESEYEYLESIIDNDYFDIEQERSLARELDRQNEQHIEVINKLYKRLHELEDVIIKDARGYEISRLQKQNKRYREAIEHTKLKLKDFRRSANSTFKLIDPRNRVAKDEAFKLQCDIRNCLEELDKKPDDRTVESPHSSWF